MSAHAKVPEAYHHGDLRAALVQLALEDVEKSGPEAVNVSALARRLRVSQPAPYRHFIDRDALLAAVATEAFRIFGAVLHQSVVDVLPERRLARICAAYVDFGRQRNGVYRLMFDSRIVASAKSDCELTSVAQASFQRLIEVLAASGNPGDEVVRGRQALGIWSSLHGIVTLEHWGFLHGHGALGAPIDELVSDVASRSRP